MAQLSVAKVQPQARLWLGPPSVSPQVLTTGKFIGQGDSLTYSQWTFRLFF